MSTRNVAVMLAVLFVGSSSSLALDKPKSEKAATKQQKTAHRLAANKPEPIYITGSFIRRPVMRNGLVTDFSSPVCVVDSTAIQRSGAANLKQALQSYGAGR